MGHSIYLADDEKSIRELLHSFLASDGYTVRSFESGDALLEAFRQEPAELVILDIMMPGTDGLTVCRELRSVSDIPIILLTAKDSELDYVMGISQGSDDYLTKPFRPTILLMKVRALLRRVEMDRGKTAAAVDELRYGDLRYSATEKCCLLRKYDRGADPDRAAAAQLYDEAAGKGLFPRGAAQRGVGLRLGGGDPRDRRNPAPYPKNADAIGQHRQREHHMGLWL